MKERQGFVSNSSSASFIVNTKHLSRTDIDRIKSRVGSERDWSVWDNGVDTLEGSAGVDNCDEGMLNVLTEELGIPKDYITYTSECCDICRMLTEEEIEEKRLHPKLTPRNTFHLGDVIVIDDGYGNLAMYQIAKEDYEIRLVKL